MDRALEELAARGLNIFAACPVEKLPQDLRICLVQGGVILSKGLSLCVFGHGGKPLWERLPKPLVEELHPIDNFALDGVTWLNQAVLKDPELQILFPGTPYLIPLQRIGRFLNLGRPSLLGLDINPEFGVWWAYRAAFLTRFPVPEKFWPEFKSPCETCAGQPCRPICPPQAVGSGAPAFNLKSCATYRFSADSRCADRCLARMNCSYKPEHRYTLEQQQYHMGRSAHLARMAAAVD
jgi:hypothetical protein